MILMCKSYRKMMFFSYIKNMLVAYYKSYKRSR